MSSTIRLALVASLLAATPAAALLHNKLLKSAPLAGVATAAPTTISLWFAEKPELALSGITLRSATDSTVVPVGSVAVLAGEKHAITAPITGSLARGAYVVQYKTVGSDGHPLRGSYVFTVK